jgi:hypothetical protein
MQQLRLLALLLLFTIVFSSKSTPAKDTKLYEMRIYYAHPGKLEDLQKRFRENTMRIFEKHGMNNLGYWVPLENTDNKLIYILSYPDKEAREKSWKAFSEDPEWKKVQSESEANGKLVAKVESIFMKTTDFSPKVKADASDKDRVFELRTYTTPSGKLNDLQARFRNHTLKLFEKHGMTNVAYWIPTEKENTLIYILAHKSKEAGEKSFDEFRKDPDWIKVKTESEKNGPLTEKVESVYMKATDYSKIK